MACAKRNAPGMSPPQTIDSRVLDFGKGAARSLPGKSAIAHLLCRRPIGQTEIPEELPASVGLALPDRQISSGALGRAARLRREVDLRASPLVRQIAVEDDIPDLNLC